MNEQQNITLPDFDDMIKLVEEIKQLSYKLISLKNRKDELVADIIYITSTNPIYWKEGKPPSFNFIESTYAKIGYDAKSREVLSKLNDEIAITSTELEKSKNMFQIMRDMIAVWRTYQYNIRETEF